MSKRKCRHETRSAPPCRERRRSAPSVLSACRRGVHIGVASADARATSSLRRVDRSGGAVRCRLLQSARDVDPGFHPGCSRPSIFSDWAAGSTGPATKGPFGRGSIWPTRPTQPAGSRPSVAAAHRIRFRTHHPRAQIDDPSRRSSDRAQIVTGANTQRMRTSPDCFSSGAGRRDRPTAEHADGSSGPDSQPTRLVEEGGTRGAMSNHPGRFVPVPSRCLGLPIDVGR